MSSAKQKLKVASNVKVAIRSVKTTCPELSISGRKSKDRSGHVIGQENFKSAGEYYAFHENILKTVTKNSRRRNLRRHSNSSEEDATVKSEIEAIPAEIEKNPEIKMENSDVQPSIEIKQECPTPEVQVLPPKDVDPQHETKPADQDDFIPISPSIQAIDEHLSELIAIQTCLAALVRKRRSIRRSKAAQLAAIARKRQTIKASQEKAKETTVAEEAKPIEIQENKTSAQLSTDPSIIMSINYEDNLNVTDFSEDDFEFPTEDDFMAYNGSPNDPMPFSDPVDFTPSAVAGDQIRQISDPSQEILAQDEFSCAPSFSCVHKTASVHEELSLDAILAIKPESTDAAWNSFQDGEFDAMHSTLMDMHCDNMEDDGWLNLTTNEVLPEELRID